MNAMLLVRRAAIAAVILAAIVTGAGAESGLICGKPKTSGRVTMHVVLRPAAGPDTVISVTLMIDSSRTADDKATDFWVAFVATMGDYVAPTHDATGKIVFAGKPGWTVTGAGIDNDETNEPDTTLCTATPSSQSALCSLSGTASGVAVDGSPGRFRVTISGRTVVVPTFPGMPAAIVEQQVIGQLNGMGVPARLATPSDFAGGLAVLPHDTSVIVMQPLDTTGFSEELNDTGLDMQLATLLDRSPPAASDVARIPDVPGLMLTAQPNPFRRDAVRIRYAGAAAGNLLDVSVFDAGGRRVRTLRPRPTTGDRAEAAGELHWDGRNDAARPVPAGVYFLRLSTPDGSVTRRIVRLPAE